MSYNTNTLLIRNTAMSVQKALNDFLEIVDNEVISPHQWKNFYVFISCAYAVSQIDRPGVSQLSDIFRAKGIKNPGTLAVLYAHGLYTLAINDGKEIYINGFNV